MNDHDGNAPQLRLFVYALILISKAIYGIRLATRRLNNWLSKNVVKPSKFIHHRHRACIYFLPIDLLILSRRSNSSSSRCCMCAGKCVMISPHIVSPRSCFRKKKGRWSGDTTHRQKSSRWTRAVFIRLRYVLPSAFSHADDWFFKLSMADIHRSTQSEMMLQ